jgi:hypothetical protein
MNSQTHVLLAVFSLLLGCTSNSGRAGSTSSTQAQGGNVSVGGSATTVSSSSTTVGGTGGAGAIGGSAISGSTGGGSVAGGTSGGSMASGGASAGTTFVTGGSGPAGAGGISTLTGGSISGGETGATSAAAGAAPGGIATGGVSTIAGGANGGAGSGGATATSVGGQTSGGMAIGGTTAGGRTTGGTATDGTATGGTATGGTATGGTATGGSPLGGSTAGVAKDSEVLLTNTGLTIVSYGGYLNGESFQQDGIVSYHGYQYAAFWNASRHVVLARRALPSGAWSTFEFTDYSLSADDAHNTISLGICPGDGTLHLSFDHHSNDLHYRKSVAGLVTNPSTATWAASSFSAVTSSLVGSTTVALVTYPRFVTEPDGNKMLFEARIGTSGSGDEYLWEYDAATHAWTSVGMYISGTADSINAYPHGLSYTRGGSRLHLSWCWRETPDASTNHDLLYIYSDDHGRTWKNNIGATVATTGSSSVSKNSSGINVWPIGQNRGLINQEHMAVDATGRVHVLLSHMPDAQADDATSPARGPRANSSTIGATPVEPGPGLPWVLPVVANFRGKLAISSSNNVYAVLPDLRIAAASAASSFASLGRPRTAPIREVLLRSAHRHGQAGSGRQAHGLLPAEELVQYLPCSTTR